MELAPEYESYVDEQYKDVLRNEGKAGQLADVDVLSGIDLYVEKGEWDKALQIARQQKVTKFAHFNIPYTAGLESGITRQVCCIVCDRVDRSVGLYRRRTHL
jgi:intraflagellar transport protein 172